MKITDVRFAVLTSPHYTPTTFRNYGVVVITTDDGRTGYGEPYVGVNLPTVSREAVRMLRTRLIGAEIGEKGDFHFPNTQQKKGKTAGDDSSTSEGGMAELHAICEYFDHRGMIFCILGAIEWALADLAAQRAGLPLHRMLNPASRDAIALYASTGSATWSHQQQVEDLHACAAKGFRTVKIRAGCCYESLDQAIARCRASAKGMPAGMRMGVDAGMQIFQGAKCWGLAEATAMARALVELNVVFFEDALMVHDVEGLAKLRKLKLVPIAGGEMFADPEQFERHMDAGAWDVCQPDACVVPGPAGILRVTEAARKRGVRVITHGWAGPVAQMQNIHAALASPACELVEFAPGLHPLMTEVMAPVWKLKEGRFLAPTAPGMGVSLHKDIEQRYAYDESVVTWIA